MHEDFTEDHYRTLLQIAKKRWRFIGFPEYKSKGNVILWRHDIDFSVQRAHRLARIEHEEGVRSTFFVNLHSCFYNALERDSIQLINEIVKMGHSIGLHYEKIWEYSDEEIFAESRVLGHYYQVPIRCFSFHNPEIWNALKIDDDEIYGMVNAYGKTIRDNYEYVSDSSGFWRFKRLYDVLEGSRSQRLHILTHDAWWQKYPMSPDERVLRSVWGRSQHVLKKYKEMKSSIGR